MKLPVAPTKSNYLSLRQQLAFASEGYDLLEQKRQILTFELMSRVGRAEQLQEQVADAMKGAFGALREALLDIGSQGLDRAIVAISLQHKVELSSQRLMGINLPRTTGQIAPVTAQFGVSGTSANTDTAMRRFVELLPLLVQLAELENAVLNLARELRKTQRRCNALSKILIPNLKETICYIGETLEERDRESFVILKMIRTRLNAW